MGLLKGGIIISLGRVLGVLVTIALNVILARSLEKVDYGLYVLIFNLSTFLGVLVVFGSQNIALRLFSDLAESVSFGGANRLLTRFLSLLFISSAVVFMITIIFYNSTFSEKIGLPDSSLLMLLLFFNGVGLGMQSLFVEVFRAFKSFFSVVLFSGVATNLISIVSILMICLFDKISIEKVLITVVLSIFLTHTISMVVMRRTLLNSDTKGEEGKNPTLHNIFRLSIPSFFNKLGLFFTLMSDVWLLSWFSTQEFVADYGAAARLAAAISFFAGISNGVIPPFVSKYIASKNFTGLQHMCRSVTTLISYPSVILLICIIFFGEEVILILFGSDYKSAYEVLVILSVAHISNALTGCCSYVLVMNGHNGLLMKISIFTGLFSFISSLLIVLLTDSAMGIVYCFAMGIVFRQILAWNACMKYCSVNTATYLNPLHVRDLFRRFS